MHVNEEKAISGDTVRESNRNYALYAGKPAKKKIHAPYNL